MFRLARLIRPLILALLAASTLFRTRTPVEELQQARSLLEPLLGTHATVVFAVALLLAGIASTDSGIIFVSLVDFADRKLSAMEIAQKLTDELYVAVPGAECYAFIPPSIPGLGVSSGISVQITLSQTRFTPALSQSLSQVRIHSPSPQP